MQLMSTHIHNLFEGTLKELVEAKSIINALRRVYAIANAVHDFDTAEWVDRQLNGYPKTASAFPNPHGSKASAYRLADLSISAAISSKVGTKTSVTRRVINLSPLAQLYQVEPQSLTKYFISNSVEFLERPRAQGTVQVQVPDLKGLITTLQGRNSTGGTCTASTASISASSYTEAAKGVRMEAIKRLMSTGLGVIPKPNTSLLNITMEQNAMKIKDESTSITATGSQISNIVAHSTLNDATLIAKGQKQTRERTATLGADDERQFREDVKQILHLLVDRYEEVEKSTAQSLEHTLKTLRALSIQGKSLAELEDMLGDIWAAQEASKLRMPEFIQQGVAATKVLAELAAKFTSPSP